MSRATEELEKERRQRQECEEKLAEMGIKMEDEIAHSAALSETCAEQKQLIERLENGLAMGEFCLHCVHSNVKITSYRYCCPF